MAEEEGADCTNNAQLFRIAVSNNLKNIAESVNEDTFLGTLTLLKSNPVIAKRLYKLMKQELYNTMNDDLEDILKEGSLEDAMTKIAKLSEESTTSANEDVWRPPGDVKLHLRSFDVYNLGNASNDLEKQIIELERENDELSRTIATSRVRTIDTSNNLMRVLTKAPNVLQGLQNLHVEISDYLDRIRSK